jgi:hypothetical protein
MKHKIVGIVICVLLIANVSSVLGIPEEKLNTLEKTNSFNYVKTFNQEGMKYTILNTSVEYEIPRENCLGPNLAPNPSFEEGDTMPTGWRYSPDTNFILHWDSNFAHSGEKSVGVLNLTNNTSPWDYGWITTDFIPVDWTVNIYLFSGWFKYIGIPPEFQMAQFFIEKFDIDYDYCGGMGVGRWNYTSEWQYMFVQTPYDEEVKYVKLVLRQDYMFDIEPDPLVEVRFDDLYFGIWTPNPPTVTGPHYGKINTESLFSAIVEPEVQEFYCQWDWGDGNISEWLGPFYFGSIVNTSHSWSEPGVYFVKGKVKDRHSAESNWSEPFIIYITSKVLLIGLVYNGANQSEECPIFNMSIAFIMKFKPIDLKMYSSAQILILMDEFHGMLGSRFLAGMVYALVISDPPWVKK